MTEKNVSKASVFPTRNYLTFLILLIVFICASMGLALAFAAPSLSSFQKWFLILSLVLFPFFSLSIITWLILRHSKKLAVSQNDAKVGWEIISSEKQKRKLNNEVRELAKHMEIPTEQLSDLRSAYIVAEDLALRKVQEEHEEILLRKINIGNSDFDAICVEDDLITCMEVTFVVTEDIKQEKINSYFRKVSAAQKALEETRKGTRVRLQLILVTQLEEGSMSKLRANIRKKFKSTPVSVGIKFLDFQNLQKIYAED